MSRLSMKLLGQMECGLGDDPVCLSTRKSEVLLAYLALAPDVSHPREKLTTLLWSDRSEEQARNSLRQTLSLIKKAFVGVCPDLLEIDRKSVGVCSNRIRVDVSEFEQLVPDSEPENLEKAVDLYRGEFLEGVSIPDHSCQAWLAAERERLQRLMVEVLRNLNLSQIDNRQYSAAIDSAERMVVYDPLQETGWRQLMKAYYLNGDRNYGLQAYQRCSNRLNTDLGVEPEAVTRELYEQIKQGEFSLTDCDISDRNAVELIGREVQDIAASPDLAGNLAGSGGNTQSREYFLQGWYHSEKYTFSDNAIAIKQFQKCLAIDPLNANAHAIISAEFNTQLYENWSNDREQVLDLSRQHIDAAYEIEPDSALVQAFLAECCLFEREFETAWQHIENAMELDPGLPDSCSMKAVILASTAQFEEAVKYADLSLDLQPHHSYTGWNAGEVYMGAGEYELAIKTFRRVPNLPNCLRAETAACLHRLGHLKEAQIEMQQYHKLARAEMPEYPKNKAAWRALWRENLAYQAEDAFDKFFNLLVQAGLCDESTDDQNDIPALAVLPFENLSSESDHADFGDGIGSDIISILSRFRGLRVVARHSIQQYRLKKIKLAEIVEQQNIRYLLTGNLRTSGNRIRLNVELVDTVTSENCWVEQYESHLDDIFAVQDDIVKNIAVALQVRFSGGERDRKRARGAKNIKLWVMCVEATELQDTYIKENILQARSIARDVLELDPEYCYAWVILGWTHWQEVYCGWSESIDQSLATANHAAQSVLALDSYFAEAWTLSGLIHVARHESEQAIEACQRAVDLDPGNAEVHALLATTLCTAGMYEKAKQSYETSLRLCPDYPAWYLLTGGTVALFFGNTSYAIDLFENAVKIEPGSPLPRIYLVDALILAGELAKARTQVQQIRSLDESFGVSGLIHCHSYDRSEREKFRQNLASVGLEAGE